MNQEPQKRINGLIGKSFEALQKEFLAIGKTHVKSWHAWLIIGLMTGITAGILFVANRSGEFDAGLATGINEMDNLDDTVDVYMSGIPSYILVANPVTGNQKADLILEGESLTVPSFSIIANVSYRETVTPKWTIENIDYSTIPAGYSPPQMLVDESVGVNVYRVPYIALKSGGAESYVMRWRVRGNATSDIRPVLLSRFISFPWTGLKRGWILKAQDEKHPVTNNDPYGPDDTNLKSFLDSFPSSIERMSNQQVNIEYEIKETIHKLTDNPSEGEMTKAALKSIGIDGTNYNEAFDWVVYTMYANAFPGYNRTPNGMFPYGDGCSQCGPGALFSDITWGSPLLDKTTLLHEFGHGIGLTHPQVNIGCAGAKKGILSAKEIFTPCKSQSRDKDNNMGSIAGDWWSPVERARLGWLRGSQVKLVTQSGAYDLYSDNDDYTSDPSKPLILQALVNRDGEADFVYLALSNIANLNSIDEANMPTDAKLYLSKGIQLSAINVDPLHGPRNGIGQVGWSELIYSRNSASRDLWEAIVKNTIQPGEEINLKWPKTNVKIKNLERIGNRATVQIEFPDIDSDLTTKEATVITESKNRLIYKVIVENIGTAESGRWQFQIEEPSPRRPRVRTMRSLDSGGSVTVTGRLSELPVTFTLDPKNNIIEKREDNNTFTVSVLSAVDSSVKTIQQEEGP